MANKTICVVVTERQHEAIKKLAEQHYHSVSAEVRAALEEHIRREGLSDSKKP